ncbi:MAG: 50S ribosomal protein L17 [Candidatus Vogelbacteria bacterium RIFOXYD1_FULL_44_32]|uniref:Large ribosomal subunit protein bL17 n=1 Tax=Candidatus Vogelbacteria bacterium RIFOXYD1_FULL_44_32 TaxID=1802438 RepID=A0A1G2QDM7_9BACT|nr:MAG: 50S ribosomal protein L17 [Candidatus Vogelbacteria bacterium RIFOXYD1_FULL_44_32]
MQHHGHTSKLGRKSGPREALIRGLAKSLIEKGRIKTTEARAKALRPYVEKLVTIAKNNTVTAKRTVTARLGGEVKLEKLFNEIGPRYKERAGGFTRIIKMPARAGDASPQAIIEFV